MEPEMTLIGSEMPQGEKELHLEANGKETELEMGV